MPKVALVFPYFRTRAQTEMLFSPLGIASLAGQLRRLGIETRLFDGTFKTFAQLRDELIAYRPDIVGISCMVTLSRNTFRIAEAVRANLPKSLLVAGGPLPTLYPQRYSAVFDAVFRGEADLSFPYFCRDYFEQTVSGQTLDDMSLTSYAGLYIDKPGLCVDNPQVHYREKEIDAFPLPDRSDFDHAAYQQAGLYRDGSKTTSILTTLGCPFDCDFCSRPVFGSRFRRRNLNAVFAEIEQIRSLGYDNLWLADDNFTLDIKYLKAFCERMIGKGMQWSCLSRVTGVDAAMANLMKAAGCRRVYLGLETGSQAILQLMNKRATVDEGINAVHQFHAAGIEVAAFFIVGYPGETLATIEETFALALRLPLDEISFNVPFPLPGSKLFERVSGVDESQDWDTENEVTFVYRTEFDAHWLSQRIEETMQAFAARRVISRA